MKNEMNEAEVREVITELVKVASKYGWVIAMPPDDNVEFLVIGKEEVLKENILCEINIYTRETPN